jgi:hypothetical protein
MQLHSLLGSLPDNTQLDGTLDLRATWNLSDCPEDATLSSLTPAEARERIETLGFEDREARYQDQDGNTIEARNRITGDYVELFTAREG